MIKNKRLLWVWTLSMMSMICCVHPSRSSKSSKGTRALVRAQKYVGLQTYTPHIVNSDHHFLRYTEKLRFNHKNPTWPGQSNTWRAQMKLWGRRIAQHGVRNIYLVHGTFVGNDPFGFAYLLQRVFPKMKPKYIQKLRSWLKRSGRVLTGDVGNWLPSYTHMLQVATGPSVRVVNWPWSSRNDHSARAWGALRLLYAIAQQKTNSRPGRILLLGHSHAGQVFALLTHFYNRTALSKRLQGLLLHTAQERARFTASVDTLRKYSLDIVTLGTPPRYTWARSSKIRLLHLINHRRTDHRSGRASFSGVLYTKEGDYVQQWGIAGSDLLNAIPSVFKMNTKLNKWLGPGVDPVQWNRYAQQRMRLPNTGKTYLIDYRDTGTKMPNLFDTLFGHGAYTQRHRIEFHLRLLCKEWYPAQSTKRSVQR